MAATPPPLRELHSEASRCLRCGDYQRALPLVIRLVLAVPPGHPADDGLRITLAWLLRKLGRHRDALRYDLRRAPRPAAKEGS